MVLPIGIVLEDLEAQALHRTCSWTLGTGGPEPSLAALPVFCFMLLMAHGLLEPRSVCDVEKEAGDAVRTGSGLGRK